MYKERIKEGWNVTWEKIQGRKNSWEELGAKSIQYTRQQKIFYKREGKRGSRRRRTLQIAFEYRGGLLWGKGWKLTGGYMSVISIGVYEERASAEDRGQGRQKATTPAYIQCYFVFSIIFYATTIILLPFSLYFSTTISVYSIYIYICVRQIHTWITISHA